MRNILIFTFIFISIISRAQEVTITLNDGEKIDTIVHSNMDNYKTFYSTVDLSMWENLVDSGFVDENGLKQGDWVEYPIDTSILSKDYNLRNDPEKQEIYKPELEMLKGQYINNEKNGVWEYYTGTGSGKFVFWTLGVETEYENDKKHGVEVRLMPFSKDTLMYIEYKGGKMDGVSKIYDANNGSLQMYGEMKNGNENGIVRKYYPNGQIEYEYIAENGYIVGECKYYNESGELVKTEIYENGEKINVK